MRTRGILVLLTATFVGAGVIYAFARPSKPESNVESVGAAADFTQQASAAPNRPRTELKLATGCRLVLFADKAEYQPKEKPALTLQATNPSEEPIEAKVALQILAMTPPSPLSRVMPMPKPVWERECLVQLEPGQTRPFQPEVDTVLTPGSQLTVAMTVGDESAALPSLAVAGEATQPGGSFPVAAARNQIQTPASN